MGRVRELLAGWAFPSLLLGGNVGAILLTLAAHARLALVLAAPLLVAAGVLQLRLSKLRARRRRLHPLRRQIEMERASGRLCLTIGLALVPVLVFLPVAIATAAALAGSIAASARVAAAVGDSAVKEGDLEIEGVSAAQECSWIELWAQRLAALPWRLTAYVARLARAKPAAGKVSRLRAYPVAWAASCALVFTGTSAALAFEELTDGPDGSPPRATKPETPPGAPGRDEDPPAEERTYEEACPELPDPLDIGHGLGALFRHDGGFKAGCGTEPEQVPGTGVWVSAGMCAGQLRSVAVAPPHGEAVLLYGPGARFAWQAALSGDLVSAEAASPAGGDVYVVEVGAGSYGFARRPPVGRSGGGPVRDCTDVTGTGRGFVELLPPMLALWGNLVEWRAGWSWPRQADRDALVFDAHPDGAEVAQGACASDLFCQLETPEETWDWDEPAYVSLDELAPYMPPELPAD